LRKEEILPEALPVKKILVTGSSGMIGTRLCEYLLDSGYEVCGIDKKANTWSRRVDAITTLADLKDRSSLKRLPKDADIVVHLAANARVYDLVVDPAMAMENIEITFNALEHCRKNSIRRFIFSSSREVYGNSNKISYKEDEVSLNRCESPYSASKIAGEALVYAYRQCYGTEFIVLRFSNVYGMYDDSDRVVPRFIKLTGDDRDLEVYGKDKILDFTYIDDTVRGILKCIQCFDGVKNNVYNIASSKGTRIVDIARLIRSYMHGNNGISVEDSRTGEVVKFIADITRAREKLGYMPVVDIEDGVRASIQWYSGLYRPKATTPVASKSKPLELGQRRL